MYAAHAGVLRIIELCVIHAPSSQLLQPLPGIHPQVFERPKLYRFRGTGLGAGRLQANFLPVIAKGALKGASVVRVAFNHAKRTRNYAEPASVTDIRLKKNTPELGADNRSGRTGFQASCDFAVLTHV
jgi:hypothetical protein